MEKPTDLRRIAFCENVARGMLLHRAYTAAGYRPNPAQATRLARRYADYIETLRPTVTEAPTEPPPPALIGGDWRAQTGISMKWVAERHVQLIESALKMRDFKMAHASIEALRKMVVEAEEADEQPQPEAQKIDVSAVLSILDRVGDTIRAAKSEPEPLPGDAARLVEDSARWKVQRKADQSDQ